MDDSKPYTVRGDNRITLSPLAREMARMHGMSETEMAKHLLSQEKKRRAGLLQQEGES